MINQTNPQRIPSSSLHGDVLPDVLPYPSLMGGPPPHAAEDDEIEVRTYFNILFDSRWLIVAFALFAALLGMIYALSVRPVYEVNMLIHVEEETPNGAKNILSEMSSMFGTKAPVSAEMELLRSRMVVTRVVDALRLYIDAQPKYFPLLGEWLAGKNRQLSVPGLFGLGGYNWGAEKLEVSRFDVPEALQNTAFTLTAGADGEYFLAQEGQDFNQVGKAGALLSVAVDGGVIELMVDQIKANPGAQFFLNRKSRVNTINQVQTALVVAEQGKQSGVIGVSLQGPHPQVVTSILSEIGRDYVQQNLARKTEEAEKSLAFLDRQLPELKQQLDQSEAKYNQFRHAHGTVDLGEEAKLSLQQSAAAKARRMELMQKRSDMLTRFTPAHPVLIGINDQLREIDAEINTVANHIKTLPDLEQELVRLGRDVKVNTDLYTALSNTAQQLRVLTAGKVSNVRLVDMPLAPEKPIKPNRPLIVAGATLLGLFLGMLYAFVRKAFIGGIDTPQRIEKLLGSRMVYASIPHSARQVELVKRAGGGIKKMPLLAHSAPEDLAIESLRSFRAALHFVMPTLKNNIVLITGPTSGLGKSFVSINFAAVMAASGKRVLLIDADFRKGHLHQCFDLETQPGHRPPGLSEVIKGEMTLDQVIHRQVITNLDLICSGRLPPNPSEFLMQANFARILAVLSENYDYIQIDPPPILPVSDTLIISQHVGAVFILTRAGVTTEAQITESIKRLNHAGVSPKGILFNDLQVRPGNYDYGGEYGYRDIRQIAYSN